MRNVSFIFISAALGVSLVATDASGSYEERLKSANQFVQKKKAFEASSRNSNALSTSRIHQLTGKSHSQGDRWVVAATRFETDQASKFAMDPEQRKDRKFGPVGIFTYEVIKAGRGLEPETVLRVTESGPGQGLKKIDDRVDSIILTLGSGLELLKRRYLLRGGDSQVELRGGGAIRSRATLLELFPLSFPELKTAFEKEGVEMPALPKQLQPIAEKHGFSPDFSRATWLEQVDLFGRRVRMLWEYGKPWPSYIEAPEGAAILISTNEGVSS